MSKNKFILTAKLDKSLIDFSQQKKIIIPTIKYDNLYYNNNSNLSGITFSIMQAQPKNNSLFNTQRYLEINDIIDQCFEYSSNVDKNKIQIICENYEIFDGKITLDSKEDLNISVSAYYHNNDKLYYLNNNICKIAAYSITCNFLDEKMIIPYNTIVNLNLNDKIAQINNTFPDNLISSYVELQDIEQLSAFNKINYLSGIFIDQNIKKQLYENGQNNYILTSNISLKYQNFQLDKVYTTTSKQQNLYIVDIEKNNNSLWLSKQEYNQLLNDQIINQNNIQFYGTKDLNIAINTNILQAYIYNNRYIITQSKNIANKVTIKQDFYCENIFVKQIFSDVYIYTTPIIKKDRFYLLNKQQTITFDNIILQYPEDAGLENSIMLSSSTNIEQFNENILLSGNNNYILQFYKTNIDNQTYNIYNKEIQTIFLTVKNKQKKINVQLNEDNYILSGIYTDNDNISLQITKYDNTYYDLTISKKQKNANGKYDYYLNNIETKNVNLLNTINTNFQQNIVYTSQNYVQILSSIIYDITCYGKLINLAEKQYTILTKNNILSGMYFKQENDYIIDPLIDQQVLIDEKLQLVESQLNNISWLRYNDQLNIIFIDTVQYDDIINLKERIINNKQQFYLKFKDFETNQIFKYTIGFRNILHFPGIKEYELQFNQHVYTVENINDIYNTNFSLQENNILTIDDNKIYYKSIFMNLPNINNINFEFLSDNKFIQLDNKILEKISQIDQQYSYNLSSQFCKYINDKLQYNLQFGKFSSKLNIYPKNIQYKNIIQNYQPYNIQFIIYPEQEYMQNYSISGIYYSRQKYNYYANLYLDKQYTENYVITIKNIYTNIKNIDFESINSQYISYNNGILQINNSIKELLPFRLEINTINNNIKAILNIE